MTKRTPKYVRDVLKDDYEAKRQNQRCVIVKEKMNKFKEDNKELYDKKNEIETKLKPLNKELANIEATINKAKKDAKIIGIESKRGWQKNDSCSEGTYDKELFDFDEETEATIRMIMSDEVVKREDFGL